MNNRNLILLTAAALMVPGLALADFGNRHGDRPGGFHQMKLERFAEYDADGDGKVTAEEIDAAEAARLGEADLNGDGNIDVDEMIAMIDQHRRERIEARMAEFDRDGDGAVSTEELAATHSERYARLDYNGDGAVTRGELHRPPHHAWRDHGNWRRHRGGDGHWGRHHGNGGHGHSTWHGDDDWREHRHGHGHH